MLAVDLDETLVSVNTFPVFVRFLLADLAAHGHRVAALRLGAALARRKALRTPHEPFKALVCRLSEHVAPERLAVWADTMLSDHGTPAVRELVAGWEGTTVLTTAAPECYAAAIGRAAGFDVVHGSTVEASGALRHNVREAKLRRLEAAGLTPVGASVSDDPVLDASLLSAAGTAWLVTGGTLRRLPATAPNGAAAERLRA